ncbi:hypothetical protein E2C01_026137 [Portunus trituberculatus]|uniref:Nucleolar protein 7 n=1 Tax=Portunus trituberculatus TaxID=210409 RepID=A0A5B7EI03_PORTR|nr:hypothetical protein [Portunus trituberculatus]
MALKKGNRHITFDDDENFEDPPALDPVGRDSDEAALEEDAEDSDSDSDAAPEEATISAGKEDAQLREDLVKSAVSKRRQEIREKRKEQHEKNKLQQEEKRKRLEERRLPQSLLEAAATEQKMKALEREQRPPTKKKKLEKFNESDGEDDGSVENVDEDGFITIDTGVKVRTLTQEVKKYTDITQRAADFRKNALYGRNTKRMHTSQLREMKEKQRKSGKAVFATLKT